MLRGLVTIVTVAALLWHTVAGCCAHHSHGGHACNDRVHSSSHASHSASNDGCCHHASAEATELGATDAGSELADSLPGTPGPCDGPGRCSEGSCVFAAQDSSGPSPLDHLGSEGLFVADSAVDPIGEALASRMHWLRAGFTPQPLGGLRIHLALGVLTL
jgi:hypothetical protein